MITPRDWPRPDGPLPRPIGDIARLAHIIGPASALALAEARGGTRLYIPRRPERGGHILVEVIGQDAVAKLASLMGGTMIRMPIGREWRCVVYRLAGCGYADIALLLGVVETTVHRWLQAQELTSPQLDMFDPPKVLPAVAGMGAVCTSGHSQGSNRPEPAPHEYRQSSPVGRAPRRQP